MKRLVPLCGLVRFLLLCLVLLCAESNFTFANPVKLRTADRNTAAQLQAQGARLVVDYGSFQILELDSTLAVRAKARADVLHTGNHIQLHAGWIDTRSATVGALQRSSAQAAGRQLHLIQFIGPVKPEWHAALEKNGVKVVAYIPQNAYLVQGAASNLAQMQAWAAKAVYVQWHGPYLGQYKIHPRARLAKGKAAAAAIADVFAIQLVEDAEANEATLALIDAIKLAPIEHQFQTLHYRNFAVRLPLDRLDDLAAQPDVISIQPRPPRRKLDERQDQILAGNLAGNAPSGPGYLAWLTEQGFTQAQFDTSAFVVDVADSGVDNGTILPGHFGLYQEGDPNLLSRVAYARLEGTPNTGSTIEGCDGHGTLNAHILSGFNNFSSGFPHQDSVGYRYGLGVCPFVRIGASTVFDPYDFTYPAYADLTGRAYRDGSRISNNSWGANTYGEYDVDAQAYDALVRDAQPDGSAEGQPGNQELVVIFAAGNAGPGTSTVGSPGTAKNVIVVGASENVRSHSTANGGNSSIGNDGCYSGDSAANSADDIANFSGRGPCSDGRQKPDLVAPGTHITGGVAQSSTATNGNGDALPCFTAAGVCALVGSGYVGNNENFFPLNQEFYTTSSGTSHAAPAVAGACALLRQYFINHGQPVPSPALTKAYLANSARYLTGVDANDTLPSPNQGMGAVNLGTAFDGVARVLHDQRSEEKFTASGQTRTICGTIVDSGKPLRVTLAWTDAPGSTTGSAYNNDLDLVVAVGGNFYKGNVFSGATSVTGGLADERNNLEIVLMPAGLSGSFAVTVTAANINSDGVPNEAPTLDQDFALVIYNATETPAPVISVDSLSVVTESCTPDNFEVDPGETVTVQCGLRNLGCSPATNLVVSLLNTGGVSAASEAQNFGTLSPGGSVVTQSFSFTANGVCGSNLVATFAWTANTTNAGTVQVQIPLGRLSGVFTQNFDSVAAPDLSAGWTTAASGAQTAWVSSTTHNDTAPNAMFSPDIAAAGVNELVSPAIFIDSYSAQLSFRHRYETELGWDGGVLEIKIGTGSFADILAAGGSFEAEGYSGSIGVGDNPLESRAAWTGSSGGFVTTIVNLPTSAKGHDVWLRWRFGCDGNTGSEGWYVDSVAISTRQCCGATLPTIALADFDHTGTNVQFTVGGTPGYSAVVEASTNLTTWQPLVTNTVPFTFSEPSNPETWQRFYRARLLP